MRRRVLLSPDVVRQLRKLRARDRALLRDALEGYLARSDATEPTRNRFRLRRPSEFAEFELRVQDWRVFYRVVQRDVQVVLIGKKRGNHVIVDGRRFVL